MITGGIPTSMEQSTGLERKELEALMAGIEVREACFMQCTCACMYFT